jgi:hypothetical protein
MFSAAPSLSFAFSFSGGPLCSTRLPISRSPCECTSRREVLSSHLRRAEMVSPERTNSTHSKPWRTGSIDNRVLVGRVLADAVQPRVPLGHGLRGVKVVLRIVDPSVSAFGHVSAAPLAQSLLLSASSSLSLSASLSRLLCPARLQRPGAGSHVRTHAPGSTSTSHVQH